MAKVVIFGAGDIARLAHYYFTRDTVHEIAAFTVDAKYCHSEAFLDLPLVSFEKVAQRYPPSEYKMFVALSYARLNKSRAEKYYAAKSLGYELVSYISSRCSFLTDYPVGDNCFILEDNTIQPFVHIGHDSIIDDHCFIASHIVVSGYVRVHSYCFIGVNATLRNSITIAPETVIGAGAVIMKDTVEKGVYLPPRAELFKKKSDEIEL